MYEFAKFWVSKGHTVKVVTSVYYKSDLKAKSQGKKINVEGINVFIQHVPISNKDNFFKRVYHFLLFSLQSFKYVFSLDYDVVMASSGPITTGIPALVARYFRKKPFVFEVRDLWPGVVEELGVIKSKPLLKAAYLFESILYRSAKLVVTLSPGMTANIQSRFPKTLVATITNSANIQLFKPFYPKPQETFALYTGNIGEVNNSTLIINTAKALLRKGRDDIQIRMIGDGQLYLELLGRVKMEKIINLKIVGSMPKNDLVAQYNAAFASIVPLLGLPLLDTSSPNKLYESLAAGIPVIQTTQGWIKKLLHDNECGFTINANDSESLADILILLNDNKQKAFELGMNARALAVERFDSLKLANDLLNNILEISN